MMSGCSLGPSLDMFAKSANKDFVFMSDARPINLGVTVLIGVNLSFHFGGSKIESFTLLSEKDSILWSVEKSRKSAKVITLRYGSTPTGFTQIFPKENQPPIKLTEGSIYSIKITYTDKEVTQEKFSYFQGKLIFRKHKMESLDSARI